MRTLQRLELPITATRTGRAPLTWGQMAIWDVLSWLPPGDASLNQVTHCPVPAGRTVDDVLAAVTVLADRHEALRSRFLDHGGDQVQEVPADSRVPVEIVEAVPDTAAAVAARLATRLRSAPFDPAAGTPTRAGIVVRDGIPAWVVLALDHLAVDGWSVGLLHEELIVALTAGTAALPVPVPQPWERAAWETSPNGLERSRRSLDFWRTALRAVPAGLLSGGTTGAGSALEWSELRSAAVADSVATLSARHSTGPASAVQAALAPVVGRYLEERDVAFRMIVATRFAPATRGMVAAFNQNALLRIMIDDHEPFGTYLGRAAEAELLAYRHAEYHPRALQELVAGLATERGIAMNGFCFFNDIRFGERRTRPVPAAAGPGPAALGRTYRLRAEHRAMDARLFFYVHALQPYARCSVGLDRRFSPGRTSMTLLRDLEHILVGCSRATSGGRRRAAATSGSTTWRSRGAGSSWRTCSCRSSTRASGGRSGWCGRTR